MRVNSYSILLITTIVFTFLVSPESFHGQSCCPYTCLELCADYEPWEIPVCDQARCECRAKTPILISLDGTQFELTDFENGVHFDLDADGVLEQTSWTNSQSRAGFLVLDRNGNGRIDDGTELFGNKTPVSSGALHTGFVALAEYDKPEHGGNSDGLIDKLDGVFLLLRLWVDENHDGISQSNELFALESVGVNSISLQYKVSEHRDKFGNIFRYRADVNEMSDRLRAIDVYLLDR